MSTGTERSRAEPPLGHDNTVALSEAFGLDKTIGPEHAATIARAATLGVEAMPTISERSSSSRSPDPAGASVRAGATVGRYLLLSQLGEGGMGVVYAAYDPELDRKVAIKLVRPAARRRGGESSTRLLREAQALAKLSHPNVVAVYDVGSVDAQIWIAMEFVEGETLSAWSRRASRSWRDVLAIMRAAGRGLAAAHAAGLLHRDFKPDNVMIGVDGRVRVMDFGLARGDAPDEVEEQLDQPLELDALTTSRLTGNSVLSRQMTRAGALLGTPAYMAPEQWAGGALTPAVDQFAFSVTLWELLYGDPPFTGDTLMELAQAVGNGALTAPTRGRRVPGWLRRVCARGMAAQPTARYPSMDALLSALDGGVRRRRRGAWALAALTAGALVAGGAWLRGQQERAAIQRCADTGREITEIWNAQTSQRVREGLLATSVAFAAPTVERVLPWIDAQAQAWSEARAEACEESTVRARWSAATSERSRWCLDQRRVELELLIEEFAEATPVTVTSAVTSAANLGQVGPCLDPDWLARAELPPQSSRDAVATVRRELLEAASMQRSGELAGAREAVERALTRARELGWPPIIARARVALAAIQTAEGAHEEAAESLREAYLEAADAEAVELAAIAATRAVHVIGYSLARVDDGLFWGRLAEIELARRGVGEDDPRRATLLNYLGLVHSERDREAALELYQRALAANERAYGPEHPSVAYDLNSLSGMLFKLGRYAEAREAAERALTIRVAALGEGHEDVAGTRNNLGVILRAAGEYERALAEFDAARRVRESIHGVDHETVAQLLNNTSDVYSRLGDHDRAIDTGQRALAIYTRVLGAEHPRVALAQANLGNALGNAQRFKEAQELYARSLASTEARVGPSNPALLGALTGLASVEVELGAPERAAAYARRALEIAETGRAEFRIANRYNLALALWALERRDDAVALVHQAIEEARAMGSGGERFVTQFEAWLAEHGLARVDAEGSSSADRAERE